MQIVTQQWPQSLSMCVLFWPSDECCLATWLYVQRVNTEKVDYHGKPLTVFTWLYCMWSDPRHLPSEPIKHNKAADRLNNEKRGRPLARLQRLSQRRMFYTGVVRSANTHRLLSVVMQRADMLHGGSQLVSLAHISTYFYINIINEVYFAKMNINYAAKWTYHLRAAAIFNLISRAFLCCRTIFVPLAVMQLVAWCGILFGSCFNKKKSIEKKQPEKTLQLWRPVDPSPSIRYETQQLATA